MIYRKINIFLFSEQQKEALANLKAVPYPRRSSFSDSLFWSAETIEEVERGPTLRNPRPMSNSVRARHTSRAAYVNGASMATFKVYSCRRMSAIEMACEGLLVTN